MRTREQLQDWPAMTVKILKCAVLLVAALFFTAAMLRAQDYSAISRLSLGATLTNVLKQTEQKLADVNVTHDGPALFQEITWWPSNVPGASYKSDSVERILFSFHNGTLYKMSERTIHTTVYFGFKQNRLVEDAGGWRQIVEF